MLYICDMKNDNIITGLELVLENTFINDSGNYEIWKELSLTLLENSKLNVSSNEILDYADKILLLVNNDDTLLSLDVDVLYDMINKND